MARSTTGWLSVTLVSLTLGLAAPARACPGEGDLMVLLGLGALLPSELGAEVPAAGGDPTAVLGWAYQFPFDPFGNQPHHLVALEVDWKLNAPGPRVGGRIGYRHLRGPFELGIGVSGDPGGLRLSPELGVRLGEGSFLVPHVRLRVEGAPAANPDLRGMMTVGWSVM